MSIERAIEDTPKQRELQAELANTSLRLLGPGLDKASIDDLVAKFTKAEAEQQAAEQATAK